MFFIIHENKYYNFDLVSKFYFTNEGEVYYLNLEINEEKYKIVILSVKKYIEFFKNSNFNEKLNDLFFNFIISEKLKAKNYISIDDFFKYFESKVSKK